MNIDYEKRQIITEIFEQMKDNLDIEIYTHLQKKAFLIDHAKSEKDIIKTVLETYLELSSMVTTYLSYSDKIKSTLKRFKMEETDQKLLQSVRSFDEKSRLSFIEQAKRIHFPVPVSLTEQRKPIQSIFAFRKELDVCKEANNLFFNHVKEIRKNGYNYTDVVEDLLDVIEGNSYIYFTQEEYNHLIEKTLIFDILEHYCLEDDILVDFINECNDQYEQYEKEEKIHRKQALLLTHENHLKSLQKLDLQETQTMINMESEEEIDETNISTLVEVNEWMDLLRQNGEINSILEILNNKQDSKLTNQFYETLQSELTFLMEELMPLVSTEEEKEKVMKEISRYKNYIFIFEEYFRENEELEISNIHENTLVFATTTNGNLYFDTRLENIQSDFQKKEAMKAMKTLKYGSRHEILNHSKRLNMFDKKDLYEFKTYGVRTLFRVLGNNHYYIIHSFVKKCGCDNGYNSMLRQSYSSTNQQFEQLKKQVREKELPEEFTIVQNNIYQEIEENYITKNRK